MALTERHRNALYQGLTRTIGDEEAVEAMLSQFPAGEGDRLATESFVRAEIAGLRTEMIQGFAEIRQEIADLRDELKDFVHAEMRLWIRWHFISMFVLLSAVVTAAKILQ